MPKSKVFEYTDPDGAGLDVSFNDSFGRTLTVFATNGDVGDAAGVRTTPAQWRDMVAAVDAELKTRGW